MKKNQKIYKIFFLFFVKKLFKLVKIFIYQRQKLNLLIYSTIFFLEVQKINKKSQLVIFYFEKTLGGIVCILGSYSIMNGSMYSQVSLHERFPFLSHPTFHLLT